MTFISLNPVRRHLTCKDDMDLTLLELFKSTDNPVEVDIRRVSDDHIASAIVSVIQSARSQGRSLEEVVAELQADDALLDQSSRQLLSDIVTQAWEQI